MLPERILQGLRTAASGGSPLVSRVLEGYLAKEASTRIVLAAVGTEREARILLKRVPDEVAGSEKTTATAIFQGFICKGENGTDVRIRREFGTDPENDPWESTVAMYTMTAKNRPTYQEAETEISKEIFDGLWPVAKSQMRKIRYKWEGWDVDAIYDSEKDTILEVWAEYEMPEGQNTVQLPDGWEAKDSTPS